MTLIDTREELLAKNAKLEQIFDQATSEKGIDFTQVEGALMTGGDAAARLDEVKALMAEVNDLGVKADEYAEIEAGAQQVKRMSAELNGKRRSNAEALHPSLGRIDGGGAPTKTLGEALTASAQFKAFQAGERSASNITAEIDLQKDIGGGDFRTGLKTLMTTSAGWAPETVRTGRMVDFATRPLQLLDLIPGETTNQTAVVFMEETTFTNAAAETAEGGLFPEAALALAEKSSPVRKIAVWLPVTDEQLEDEAQVQSYINNRLGFMIRQRLDSQIAVGTGTAPNLEGVQNRAGIQALVAGAAAIATAQAKAEALLADIRKMKTLVRTVGRAIPNVVMLNPTDIETLVLLRDSQGRYIMGNPNDDTGVERLWGMRVAEVEAITAERPVVGDTTMTGLAIKKNLTLAITNAHTDFFINGKNAIRADMRAALQVYRPSAFVRRNAPV